MDDEIAALCTELRQLTERVAALERPVDPAPALTAPEDRAISTGVAADPGVFWALEGLQARLGDQPATREGAVLLTGSATLPTGETVAWQQSVGTAGQLEVSWEDHAASFAALAHPVRLELLRHILNGVRTTSDLAEIEPLGTTGQLHHHLRQLVAAGWVKQGGRGVYEIPAARIVPLLACLLGVDR